MSDRRDAHEDTHREEREQAANIAGLKAEVRRDHEYIESVSAKGQEVARTVQELELKAENLGGRVIRLEEDREKGSARMGKIEANIENRVEPRIKAIEDHQLKTIAWVAGASAGAVAVMQMLFWLFDALKKGG